MMSELAFFSFVRLKDQSQHRVYNEWHQLDHRPENLALPGVLWGDRWARPDEYREGVAAPELQDVDYAAMYWFDSPVERSRQEWQDLGAASFQWGRGPALAGVERPFMAFFRPVKGYSAPRVLVAPEILPYRPNRGIHLQLTYFSEPHSPVTHDRHAWEDRVAIPELLEVDGVAGAWTFSFASRQGSGHPESMPNLEEPGAVRLRLLYLDTERDPLETTAAIAQTEHNLTADGRDGRDGPVVGTVVFDSAAKTIIPWQDW